MSSSNCCFLTCIQVSQEEGQAVWYSHFFQNFPQFVVIHTTIVWINKIGVITQFLVIHIVKDFTVVDEADVAFFVWNSLTFSMIQWILTN